VLPGSYDLFARAKDGRVGFLMGVHVDARERKEHLQIAVRPGAIVAVKTTVPEHVFFRYEAEWEGIELASGFEDAEPFGVPSGHLVVRWFRLDQRGGQSLDHVEDRTVEQGQKIVLEWQLR